MTNAQKVRESCSETDAHLRLEALKELLQLYREQAADYGKHCPLCMIGCRGCPWYLFGGGNCADYRDEHFHGHWFGDYSNGDSTVDVAWRKRRMRQLPNWIFSYEQALRNWR